MSMTRRQAIAAGGAAAALGAADAKAKGAADPLAAMDAVETAQRIKAGTLSAAEATEAAIARAERINPQIHAIVNASFDRARAQAKSAPTGVFGGVPTFRKDLNDLPGVPTEFGSRAFKGFVPSDNPYPFFKRFDDMGFVYLGKSSTPEFGLTATTEPLNHPASRNPWNTDHSTGGSSGGAAALVASGVVPVAHASDGGGSIRIPASCCGLFGLKVSRGRNPSAFDERGMPIVLSVHGVVSRTVRDSAAFFAAMDAKGDGLPEIGLVSGPSSKRLKIGFFTAAPQGTPVDPRIVKATERAAKLCADLGHAVAEIAPPIDASPADDFLLYWAAGAARSISEWEKAAKKRAGYGDFEPLTMSLAAHYEVNRARMDAAVARLSQFPAIFDAAFGSYDMLLSPVLAAPPPPIGYLSPTLAYPVAIERLLTYAAFTGGVNLAGTPAMSVPLNWADGLPVGAHFMARRGQERMLLELAFELEAAAQWAKKRPPVFG